VEKEQLYKRRQTIAEHPFGTIKRQWGYSYILTKQGINRACSDVGFMFIAYNLRRIINVLGHELMNKYLGMLTALYSGISGTVRIKFSLFQTTFFIVSKCIGNYWPPLKPMMADCRIDHLKWF